MHSFCSSNFEVSHVHNTYLSSLLLVDISKNFHMLQTSLHPCITLPILTWNPICDPQLFSSLIQATHCEMKLWFWQIEHMNVDNIGQAQLKVICVIIYNHITTCQVTNTKRMCRLLDQDLQLPSHVTTLFNKKDKYIWMTQFEASYQML